MAPKKWDVMKLVFDFGGRWSRDMTKKCQKFL